MSDISRERLAARIPADCAGLRLDQALARMFPEFSRSRLAEWVKAGRVRVDGRLLKPRDAVAGGEHVAIDVVREPLVEMAAQPIALDVLYEDQALLVINKPAGLVVHPGAGVPDGTLQNALLHRAPELAAVPRCGIVHRLDKDTSGLMVVARTLEAHAALVARLKARTIVREYEAVVTGLLTAGGTIDAPIARHRTDRLRMAIDEAGRRAVTHYRVLKRFRAHTHVAARLETGRTHQIRVHFAHIHHPLLGDPLYGRRLLLPKGADAELVALLRDFRRQALHARRLELEHPLTGEYLVWSVPPPADMLALLEALARDARAHAAS
ncbi:MAG TPA: 23S rRNA pseudouridine(1911/1915/1917) synthase RluD [Gammaproteobacteria bacterium]|nr:23S rRNA pseudouridine(1911/1915/1917) synthase RluD [Gammaproteobacteria bacterium]